MENNKVGRPLKFKSVEELQEKIDAYFESCYKTVYDTETRQEIVENVKPMTITGLALALDTTRDVLLDYEEKDKYSSTVKKAKLRIENFAEESLFTSRNTAGVIFNLKNNYHRWTDKQEVESRNSNLNVNSDISNLSDEERRARINELITKRGT